LQDKITMQAGYAWHEGSLRVMELLETFDSLISGCDGRAVAGLSPSCLGRLDTCNCDGKLGSLAGKFRNKNQPID